MWAEQNKGEEARNTSYSRNPNKKYLSKALYTEAWKFTKPYLLLHVAALKDLFSHYTEAWKTWYSEVAGKNPIRIS